MGAIKTKEYKVVDAVIINDLSTNYQGDLNAEEKKKFLLKVQTKLSKKQDAMYAHNRHSFLICLQGMDTSGKDSLIREVFKEFNPRGVVVHSFKTPSSSELEHDFLWRHYVALPEKGKFTVFNRTHYENVLVTRVHPEYLLSENLPGIEKVDEVTDDFWKNRFDSINRFEKHLSQNGTTILKFFLHMSKEEQRKRLLKRLEHPEDNWKFSANDLKEREHWDDYMTCYEDAINNTSTKYAPWYVIPSDDKAMSRCIIAKIIWKEIQKLTDIKEPELPASMKAHIEEYKEQLKEE